MQSIAQRLGTRGLDDRRRSESISRTRTRGEHAPGAAWSCGMPHLRYAPRTHRVREGDPREQLWPTRPHLREGEASKRSSPDRARRPYACHVRTGNGAGSARRVYLARLPCKPGCTSISGGDRLRPQRRARMPDMQLASLHQTPARIPGSVRAPTATAPEISGSRVLRRGSQSVTISVGWLPGQPGNPRKQTNIAESTASVGWTAIALRRFHFRQGPTPPMERPFLHARR